MADRQEVTLRLAARVLLCDTAGRILMFKMQFEGRQFWIAPGGGLNDSETYEDAAVRELWEETGLQVECDSLKCVWLRSHTFEFQGRLIEQQERYFLLRCEDGPELTDANMEDYERNDLVEHRWWSAGEIEASPEVFAPRSLGALVRSLMQDGPPEAPFDVGI